MKNIEEIYIHNIKYASVPQWRPQPRFGGVNQTTGGLEGMEYPTRRKIFQN